MSTERARGEVIARAVLHYAEGGAFGVIVREASEASLPALLRTLAAPAGQGVTLRVSIPSATPERAREITRLAREAGLPAAALDTTVEGAERWRNDPSVTDTIVVIILREIPKLSSLNRFKTIGYDALYQEVCSEGRAALGVNEAQRELWRALAMRSVARTVPFDGLLTFFAALQALPPDDLPTSSRGSLHLLGLLPDPHLFVTPSARRIAERLQQNQRVVDQIEVLSRTDRQKITRALATYSGAQRDHLRRVYRDVMTFHREQDPARLAPLTLEDVETLLRIKPLTEQEGETPRPPRPDEVPPAVRAIDHLLEGAEDDLRAMGTLVRDAIETHDDEDAEEVRDPASGDVLAVRYDHPFLRLIERCVGAESWGGLIDVEAPTLDGALAILDKVTPRVFDPDGAEWAVRQTLVNLSDTVTLAPELIAAWDEFAAARRTLASHLKALLIEPLAQLPSTPEYFATAERYLAAYGRLIEGLRSSYEAIAEEAPDGVEILCSRVLALDTIVLRSSGVFRAVLSPLHPLHLWKYVELARQIRAEVGRFSDAEKDLLRDKVDDLPNFVTTLYLPHYITQCGARDLPEAGVRSGIPHFEELALQYGGRDGIKELIRVLERFCVLYPHARLGLRVALIDPPELDLLLQELARFADHLGDALEALHVRVFFTAAAATGVAALGGGAKDEEGAERFRGTDTANRFTLEIQEEPSRPADIAATLQAHPAHVLVLFDPSSAKALRVPRSPSLVVHPLCLPMQFTFDRITHVVRVVPASDGGIFSDHNDLRSRLSRHLTGVFFGVASEAKAEQRELAGLAARATWFAVLDRAQEGTLAFGVPRVALVRCGKRDLAIYARDLQKFLDEFDRQLRLCNYTPSQEALRRLVHDLDALLGDGLLSLVSPRPAGATLDERRTKGLLGVLVAAAWYRDQYAQSLLVSIDSPEARRWLELRDDGSRADLLGIVDEPDGSITVDLAEVKTYEHPEDAYRVDHGELRGAAIDQLLNTARIIDEVFAIDPSQVRVVSPQRREILRQQLFRECFFEQRSDEEKLRWKDRLNALFALDVPIRLRLSLVVVGLTHAQGTQEQDYRARERTVRLVRLTEEDVRRYVSGSAATLPRPSAPADAPTTSAATPAAEPVGTAPDSEPLPAAPSESAADREEQARIREHAAALRRVLRDYNVPVVEIDPERVQVGPSVLRFRVRLGAGARIQALRSRAEDIGRELACHSTPLIDNIPGEPYVGIDLERPHREIVGLRDALSDLPTPEGLQLHIATGVTPDGSRVVLDLVQLPHLLVAGSTMSGKTVFLHAVVLSLLARHTARDLELVLIDPKATDFVFYNGLPCLRDGRVITEPEDAIHLLQSLTTDEVRTRTQVLQAARCPNLFEFNAAHPDGPLRPIVVVIDEYADLVAVLGRAERATFERDINRLAQRARSVGIHLVLATQRPTTDIVTGTLKANMPCRISFRLPQRIDSQVILDQPGAENLFGRGDMLLFRNDQLTRLQGYYASPQDLPVLLATLPGAHEG